MNPKKKKTTLNKPTGDRKEFYTKIIILNKDYIQSNQLILAFERLMDMADGLWLDTVWNIAHSYLTSSGCAAM